MEHSQFTDFFFVNAAIIQNVIYTLEGDFSVARQRLSYFVFLSVFQQFILRSTSNHISSLLKKLFNKYGYHFSFHRSMMKEFTIMSTPDLHRISFYSPVYGKIHDFQFQAVHIRRYFSNISRHWIHNSSSSQNNQSNYFFLSISFPTGLQQNLE